MKSLNFALIVIISLIFFSIQTFGDISYTISSDVSFKATERTIKSTKTNYPLTVIDDFGNEVEIPAKPTRIVSLASSCTELVFAVGGGSLVVGVDDFSDYPAGVAGITSVGGFTLNKEVILALEPDLVLAAATTLYDTSGTLDTLAANNTPVVFLDAANITGIIHDIELLGQILDDEASANNVATSLQDRLNSVISAAAARTVKPKIYLDLPSITPGEYYTFGPGSFGDDLINLAGGINIAASLTGAYPQIAGEVVIASNPDIIIFTNGTYFPTTVDAIKERTGWSEISAVKNEYVHAIDENLVQRSGPRIVDGLEKIALLISEWYNDTIGTSSETVTEEDQIISGWTVIPLSFLVIPIVLHRKR
ncbi:MAG: ABC transporter substrate-binding protein [Candidatus Hodarchaeota archaeon]